MNCASCRRDLRWRADAGRGGPTISNVLSPDINALTVEVDTAQLRAKHSRNGSRDDAAGASRPLDLSSNPRFANSEMAWGGKHRGMAAQSMTQFKDKEVR